MGQADVVSSRDMGRQFNRFVYFDLGGVWIRIRYWREACLHAGVEAGALEGKVQVLERLWHEPECGRCGWSDFVFEAARATGLEPGLLDAAGAAVLREPYPGTDALLDALASHGIGAGCLSNTNALHWEMMSARTGRAALPMHRLDRHVLSFREGVMKPLPGIYERAEAACGLSGAAIVFFDDKDENVRSALARGWHAHRIEPDGPELPAVQMRRALQAMGWM